MKTAKIKAMFFNRIRVAFYLAFRQLKRANKWTTGLIVFIMMLTFLNLVVVNGILVGLIQGSFNQFKQRYSGDIIITPQDRLNNIDKTQELLIYIKAQTGVIAAAPRFIQTGTVRAELSQNPTGKQEPNESRGALVGIDPDTEDLVTGFSSQVTIGQPLEKNDTESILVGANLIKEYSSFADANFPGLTLLRGTKIGDRVRLSVPVINANGPTMISKEYTVKGIVKSKVDQLSQRFFIISSELRKLTSNTDLNYQEIAVRVDPQYLDSVYNSILSNVDPSKVRVQLSAAAVPSFLLTIRDTFGVLGNAIGSIGLIVTSITTFIVIFINAVTRRKYIGIMKGIGIESSVIEMAYVMQAVFYGILGSLLGFIVVFSFLVPLFEAKPLDFPFSDGILAASLTGSLLRAGILLLITIVAGFLPARMIVKKNTLDSILGR